VTDVALLPDGDLLLAGQRAHASDSLDAIVMRVDSLGHAKWERTVGGSGRDRGFYIDVNARGDVALVGLTTTAPAQSEDLLVVVLDVAGRVKWRRHLGEAGYQTGRGWDAYVARLDRDARVIWQGTQGGTGDQTAYAAVISNGRVAVAGHEEMTSERKRDVALFFTDLDGIGLTLHSTPR
jgi:hypothetical protein